MSNPTLMFRLLTLSHIPCWSIVPHTRPQTVAEHTFRAMVIARELLYMLRPEDDQTPVSDVVFETLVHDIDEAESGDIPSTFKSKDNGLESEWPSTFKSQVIKLADIVERLTYISIHRVKGATSYQAVVEVNTRFEKFMEHMGLHYDQKSSVRSLVRSIIEEGV